MHANVVKFIFDLWRVPLERHLLSTVYSLQSTDIKVNILDTRLLWGNSLEEMFGNVLRLMRFGVYFEITLNRK